MHPAFFVLLDDVFLVVRLRIRWVVFKGDTFSFPLAARFALRFCPVSDIHTTSLV